MKKFESYKIWINEKFVEDDDDPIESMGIGLMHEVDKIVDEYVKHRYFTPPDREQTKKISYKIMVCIFETAPLELIDYLIPLLIEEKKDVQSKSEVINDLLIRSVTKKYLALTELLVKKYDANIYNNNARVVSYALSHRFIYALKYFFSIGFDPNYNKSNIFIAACSTTADDFVQEFINQGVDIHAQDDRALFTAARNGRTKNMRILLKHGAKVNDSLQKHLSFWKRSRRRIRVTTLMEKLGYKF